VNSTGQQQLSKKNNFVRHQRRLAFSEDNTTLCEHELEQREDVSLGGLFLNRVILVNVTGLFSSTHAI